MREGRRERGPGREKSIGLGTVMGKSRVLWRPDKAAS
jgi:hypothetical protein